MSQNLKDKVAIVTGGAGGIGSRIAKTYAGAGAKVVIASRSQGKLDKVAGEIDGDVLALATDVTVPEQVDNMVAKTIDEFGGIDILVNNAGGAMFIKSPNDLEPNEWDAAIALNLSSVFLCSRAVSNNMMERGSGRIINISSVAGMRLSPSFVHYGAAKAGVINLTKGLAMSWAPNNINVNCIAPGLTATEGVASWLPEKTKEDGTSVPPLLYPPDPEHVADLALFLASELSAHISGELFPIRSLTELA